MRSGTSRVDSEQLPSGGLRPGMTMSIVLFQSSKSEVNLGGTDRKVK